MIQIEYDLLSAFRSASRVQVYQAVNEVAKHSGYSHSELFKLVRNLHQNGYLFVAPNTCFENAWAELTADGIIALEQRQEELYQLAADRTEREISRKDQKKSNALDLLFKILSAIAGFFAFLI